MKAGTRVELPLWLGEMLAVAGGYVFECSRKRRTMPSYLLLLMAILCHYFPLRKDSGSGHKDTGYGKAAPS
jgi:hypothetical protein